MAIRARKRMGTQGNFHNRDDINAHAFDSLKKASARER